ncbi:MAG: hypothetical protein H0V70_27165 [Ktedonobacteraceae bacterium]|nr:hypothetical protein [Ktedonobacteraceae bacterium]
MNILRRMAHLRCPWLVLFLAFITTLLLVACDGTMPPATNSIGTPNTTTTRVTSTTAALATTAPAFEQVSIGTKSDGSFAFAATITIPKGTKVVWLNETSVLQAVTSDNGAFPSSGTFGPGHTYAVVFHTAGTFSYHCTRYPYMTAQVIVIG